MILDCCWQVEMVKRESRPWFLGSLDEGEMVLMMVEYGVEVSTVANEAGGSPHDGGGENNHGGGVLDRGQGKVSEIVWWSHPQEKAV